MVPQKLIKQIKMVHESCLIQFLIHGSRLDQNFRSRGHKKSLSSLSRFRNKKNRIAIDKEKSPNHTSREKCRGPIRQEETPEMWYIRE